jgi:hypothetical protein
MGGFLLRKCRRRRRSPAQVDAAVADLPQQALPSLSRHQEDTKRMKRGAIRHGLRISNASGLRQQKRKASVRQKKKERAASRTTDGPCLPVRYEALQDETRIVARLDRTVRKVNETNLFLS